VRPLRVLIVEDNPRDAELIVAELRRAGFDPEWDRVETAESFLEALSPDLDVILSDFYLPGFDATRALELRTAYVPEVPLIIVSGTLGEETAVSILRDGAADYLLKDRLARLGMAVTRALEHREIEAVRRRAEADLKEREERYRAIIEGTTDAVYLKDRHGRYVAMNSAGAALVGKPVDEIIGRTDAALFSPDAMRRTSATDHLVLRHGTPITFDEVAELDGKRRTFSTTKAAWRGADGEILGILGISRDVTQRLGLEGALSQAQKMEAVGRLAGGVAHDFNNLLTAILGYGELILMQADGSSEIRSHVEEIMAAANRAASLTRQLLAFSRQQTLRPEPLDLNEIVQGIERMMQRILGEDLTIVLDLDPSIPPVEVDRNQVEQVLINLAVNARDAMPRGGTLRFASGVETVDDGVLQDMADPAPDAPSRAHPGRYAWLSVTDTGVGMDAAIQSKIFEPFFTTKEPGKGTGLGLSMVFGVVKQSGGFIGVESAPGDGTAMTVYFPQTPKPPEPGLDGQEPATD